MSNKEVRGKTLKEICSILNNFLKRKQLKKKNVHKKDYLCNYIVKDFNYCFNLEKYNCKPYHYKFTCNQVYSFKLKILYKLKQKNRKALYVALKKKHEMRYKGKHGTVTVTKQCKLNSLTFSKFIYKFSKQLKRVNNLTYSAVGVIGRGMGFSLWQRQLLRDGVSFFNKRSRKNVKRFYNCLQNVVKKKVKRKSTKRKKKKVYTWQVYNKNRFIRKKLAYKRVVTRLGERGHLIAELPRKAWVAFKKKNALYKVIYLISTLFNKSKLTKLSNALVKKKRFGPYKVKGLKFLGKQGRLKEGKTRKL